MARTRRATSQKVSEEYSKRYCSYPFYFNNTIVSISDEQGNVILASRSMGFKGRVVHLLLLVWLLKLLPKPLWSMVCAR